MITKATLQSAPKYLTTIEIENHTQLLDEPVSLGGNNQGPTPVQSVYSALAGCICMTLRLYADGKNIPLGKIDVTVDAQKKAVSEKDEIRAGNEQMIDKGKIRFIHVKIRLYGKISSAQLEKMDAIVEKCPVHKMLHHGSLITHETFLSEAS